MIDITQKTLGELIDQLISTNIKCFMAQEIIHKETDVELIAKASKVAQETNNKRNQLIRAIDKYCGYENQTPLEKTYAE